MFQLHTARLGTESKRREYTNAFIIRGPHLILVYCFQNTVCYFCNIFNRNNRVKKSKHMDKKCTTV